MLMKFLSFVHLEPFSTAPSEASQEYAAVGCHSYRRWRCAVSDAANPRASLPLLAPSARSLPLLLSRWFGMWRSPLALS